MRIAFFLAAGPVALAALACGAPSDPEPTATAAQSEADASPNGARSNELFSPGPIRVLDIPCPSSWCGASDDCVTWTCEEPLINPTGTFTCSQANTTAGTWCNDSAACITGGTCSGSGLCIPYAGGQEFCDTTPRGAEDGYQCGACVSGACSARFGLEIVDPAPAWACTLVSR